MSDNSETHIGSRSEMYSVHEEQYHCPIHGLFIHDHPVSDCYVWENIFKPTDWPQTEHKINAIQSTDPNQ